MIAHTPKMLPWLARKAGISEARAEELWVDAIRHATETTGWVGTSEYWRVAVERWVDLIEAEDAALPLRRPAMVRLQARMMLTPFAAWPIFGLAFARNWQQRLAEARRRQPAPFSARR